MNTHKGLSVRVFKASTLASNSYAPPTKLDVGHRSISGSDLRTTQGDEYFSDMDVNRKALVRADITKRSSLYSNPSTDPPMYERRRSSANYEIRPSTTQGTYFYERSISSKSDIYPSSDSSNTDEDSICDSPSSVTTNLSTVLPIGTTTTYQSAELTLRPSKPSSPSSPAVESFPVHIPTNNRTHDSMSSDDDGAALTTEPPYHSPLGFLEKTPSRRLPIPPASESSDDTVVSGSKSAVQERGIRPRVVSRSKGQRDSGVYPSVLANQYPSGNIESAGSALQVRFDSEIQEIPESRYAVPFSDNLQKDVDDQFDAQSQYLPHPPGLERYSHSKQGTPAYPVYHIPRRRGSDGDQTINMPSVSTNPPFVEHLRSSSAPPARSVRWNENLICPSPILASQRRQGWFNRRG